MKRLAASMLSKLLIWRPTVGWVICSRRAAPVKLPSCATARKVR